MTIGEGQQSLGDIIALRVRSAGRQRIDPASEVEAVGEVDGFFVGELRRHPETLRQGQLLADILCV